MFKVLSKACAIYAQVCKTGATMQESLQQLRQAKKHRRRAAQTKAITFVTGVGLVAGGAGLTATGVGESSLLQLHTMHKLLLEWLA